MIFSLFNLNNLNCVSLPRLTSDLSICRVCVSVCVLCMCVFVSLSRFHSVLRYSLSFTLSIFVACCCCSLTFIRTFIQSFTLSNYLSPCRRSPIHLYPFTCATECLTVYIVYHCICNVTFCV